MLELALHILDIAENGLRAGATLLEITVEEDPVLDLLTIIIADNGHGMDEDQRARVLDPFYTTKTVRRVGLGLPLFAQAAERTDGDFSLESSPEQGTVVRATFRHSHVDRQPLGDLAGTVTALILESPETDLRFSYGRAGRSCTLDTRQLRLQLEGVPLDHPRVLGFLREYVAEMMQDEDQE